MPVIVHATPDTNTNNRVTSTYSSAFNLIWNAFLYCSTISSRVDRCQKLQTHLSNHQTS